LARTTLSRLAPDEAVGLGIIRAVVHGVFLASALAASFSDVARLPAELLRPTGLMQLLPWGFYDALLTPRGMLALKALMVTSLALSAAGLWTRATTKTSALLVIFYQGLLRSIGAFNHDEMAGVYFLVVLAFTPCGDAFSLDGLRDKGRSVRRGFAYAYPVFLMRMLLAWIYFSSALIKLRFAGLSYFSPDNLPSLAVYHSLGNLSFTHFRVAFWLPRVREWTPLFVGAALIWELLFPLAVFSKRARPWVLGFGVLFHLATTVVMNISFPYTLAMYLVFVDWPAVARRFPNTRPGRRV
jgi:hypothetical protein